MSITHFELILLMQMIATMVTDCSAIRFELVGSVPSTHGWHGNTIVVGCFTDTD
ncbi:hypothetical protein L3Q72_05210 [Vibrio sp. JC009]|uniref:hypothetical protein n=1 Tax=Vibrio sp. JC009 TaxID=2912314 RepID=UPI0023B14C5E|nr:hypothetical protein [Vibrio sp. JC009]WED22793.1 hypothetical protein L3Q72_05210 [Vibrio sp. JC009]